MTCKTILKILIIFIATIVVLLLGAFLYLPTYINTRITSQINDHTEFGIEIEQVSFSGISSLEFRNIRLQHKLDKEKYIESKDFQTDWISCKVASFSISNINWIRLFSDKNFFADHVLINSPDIYIFRDKRVPSKYKYVALPAMLLREMTFPFSIPVIEIENGKIIYEEITLKTLEKIQLPFYDLRATIYHMSSDSLYLLSQPIMSIEAKASIFDSVKTEITYTANTLNPNNVFSLKGNMQSFSATLLNRCITPATHVIIDDGIVNGIHFKFTANENVANGIIDMDYKDLKLTVLEKDNKDKPKRSELKSFIANIFVRNQDPKVKNNIRGNASKAHQQNGKIHFERRKDRFIFNYWWNAFKSGVTSTVVIVPIEKIKK